MRHSASMTIVIQLIFIIIINPEKDITQRGKLQILWCYIHADWDNYAFIHIYLIWEILLMNNRPIHCGKLP